MPTSVIVPVAQGVEEMEAVIILDVFRRAGWKADAVGLDAGLVTASRGVRLLPDCAWSSVRLRDYEALVLPGGAAGTEALARDTRVLEAVRTFRAEGKWLGAICAAPLVLQAAGVLSASSRVTCHPAVAGKLTATPRLAERTVVDGRLVTSQGPGTAMEFALTLVRLIAGEAEADALASAMGMSR